MIPRERLFAVSLSQAVAQEDAEESEACRTPLVVQTPHDESPNGVIGAHLSCAVGVKGSQKAEVHWKG